jgi:pyrroline-5-carboxylate reductase
MSETTTLGFIGAGNMAEAIARAAIGSGVVEASRVIAADPSAQRRRVFEGLGATVFEDNEPVVERADQVLLAIKPQALGKVAGDLAGIDRGRQVVISIMAGLSTGRIEQALGGPARVVRVMPNTPLMAGAGMAAIALGEHAEAGDEALAEKLLGAAGERIVVDESLMDAVTAVSGSGPAYVFYLAEAMERAADELGLGGHGRLLVAQTLVGAAKLLAESDVDPAELRRRVTSPGGTTEAAINHLDANKTAEVFVNAIRAAESRSRELGAS